MRNVTNVAIRVVVGRKSDGKFVYVGVGNFADAETGEVSNIPAMQSFEFSSSEEALQRLRDTLCDVVNSLLTKVQE